MFLEREPNRGRDRARAFERIERLEIVTNARHTHRRSPTLRVKFNARNYFRKYRDSVASDAGRLRATPRAKTYFSHHLNFETEWVRDWCLGVGDDLESSRISDTTEKPNTRISIYRRWTLPPRYPPRPLTFVLCTGGCGGSSGAGVAAAGQNPPRPLTLVLCTGAASASLGSGSSIAFYCTKPFSFFLI